MLSSLIETSKSYRFKSSTSPSCFGTLYYKHWPSGKLIALIKGVGKKAKSLMDDGKKKMAAGMSDAKAKAQAKMAAMRGGEETV